MSFLKNVFKKKPGGTLFGNLLRIGSNKLSGGILGNGANMLPAGTPTTFAGQSASVRTDGTIDMLSQLPEVRVTPLEDRLKEITGKLGDAVSPFLKNATSGVQVGADNKTLLIVGGAAALLAAVLLMRK